MLRQQVVFILSSAVIASGVSVLANQFSFFYSASWPIALFFFLGLNTALLILYSLTRRSADFTGILLGCLVGKLLLSLITLLLFRVFSPLPLLPFALHFIAH